MVPVLALVYPRCIAANGSPDVIELGIPFTDPIADGVTIQKSNTVRMLSLVIVDNGLQVVIIDRPTA